MILSSTTRRLGSNFGTPPPTLSTTGTKPAAARPAPRDTCDTTLQNPCRPFNVSGRRSDQPACMDPDGRPRRLRGTTQF